MKTKTHGREQALLQWIDAVINRIEDLPAIVQARERFERIDRGETAEAPRIGNASPFVILPPAPRQAEAVATVKVRVSDPVTIGMRIAAVRVQAGWHSQIAFDRWRGLPPGTISRAESGKKEISPATMAKIAVALGVSEHWLRTGEGSPFGGGAEA